MQGNGYYICVCCVTIVLSNFIKSSISSQLSYHIPELWPKKHYFFVISLYASLSLFLYFVVKWHGVFFHPSMVSVVHCVMIHRNGRYKWFNIWNVFSSFHFYFFIWKTNLKNSTQINLLYVTGINGGCSWFIFFLRFSCLPKYVRVCQKIHIHISLIIVQIFILKLEKT